MMIDSFYTGADKSSFYLGMVSQVYKEFCVIQVENLSWLSHRKIKLETLIPNTINFLVVIETVQGIFIGEVYQSKVGNSDNVHKLMNRGITEEVYPEISINIIGLLEYGRKQFRLAGFQTAGITDKVYIANDEIINIYLSSIEVDQDQEQKEHRLSAFANFSNFKNQGILLKPSTLFNRHFMAIGATNSGKSTSALSILDKLVNEKKKILIIDPTGEYKDAFEELNTEDGSGEIKKLTLGMDTIISVGELESRHWEVLFETNDNTQGAMLADAIKSLRYQNMNAMDEVYQKREKFVQDVEADMSSVTNENKDFNLQLLPKQINEESVEIGTNKSYMSKYVYNTWKANTNAWLVQKVNYNLNNTNFKDFFSIDVTKMDLIKEIESFVSEESTSLYIDTSNIGTSDGIGGMIIDLITNYLMNLKMTLKSFVLFIDEAHRYTQPVSSSMVPYSGLTTIAREGRKKGVFLFLTTQNPQDVPDVILGQVGTLLVHRLTHAEELRSIQNHLKLGSIGQIRNLHKGQAILSSVNLLQDIHLTVLKCSRSHQNSTPTL